MNSYEQIAPFYDYEHEPYREDIDFYRQLLTAGPILEVGAGTGRVTAALAAAGLEIWGVEPSPAMAARAAERLRELPGAHLILSPLEELDLDRRFRAVLLPLNALWHFTTLTAQLRALRTIRRHLLPRGMLVVDLSNPFTMADRGAAGEVRQRFHTDAEDGTVTGFSAAWDDEGEQVLHLELWYDQVRADGIVRRTETELDLRYLYRNELELLVRHGGFRPGTMYGSYDLEPYGSTSARLIAIAFAA